MKVRLTKPLSGKISGNIGDVIDVDEHLAQAVIRQNAGLILKSPTKESPKERKKEKEKIAP